ncbi:hypothetical protein PAXINDRAFT_70199 [Paxillus involutus ATCC 200175]|nr:hypothetical protein PAXINDRAFT_70199 [Paxillus involutus ATCC 200175]
MTDVTPSRSPKPIYNVVIVGETGAGKSCFVNLVIGLDDTQTANNICGVTIGTTCYGWGKDTQTFRLSGSLARQLGLTILRLWDAVRLEEPQRGTNVYLGAIDNAIQLIQCLNATGGISLLLFYMRGNRATVPTVQMNYTLFHGVLITKEDPIAFAIPHVQKGTEMEGWWSRNSKMLEKNGIVSTGRPCITTLRSLSQVNGQRKFSMPSDIWNGRCLKGLGSLLDKSFPGRSIRFVS